MSEESISLLEAQVPLLSGVAFAKAREEALASGLSVLQSENGVIFEVFPDGRKIRIKDVAPPTPVVPGSKFLIR